MNTRFVSVSSVIRGLLLSTLLPLASAAADAQIKDFSHQLTIQSNYALEDGIALENFPVLVRLSEATTPGFSYADFQQPNGADLRFLDEGGEILAHEIQSWNPEGESLVWVRIPSLSASSVFFMFYGTALSVPNTPADTWSTYAGVWHFDEGVAGGTSIDSTANHFDGENADGIQDAEGVFGRARVMASGGILLSNTQTIHMGQGYTLSGWVYHDGTAAWDHLIYRKNASGEERGFAVEFNSANDNSLNTLDVISSWSGKSQINPGITGQTWHYISLVQFQSDANDGTETWLYNNGVLQAYGKAWWSYVNHREVPIAFGTNSQRTGMPWHGKFDEFRLRFARATPEWAAAEYASMTDPNALRFSVSTVGEKLLFDDNPTITWEGGDSFMVHASLKSGTGDILFILPDLATTNLIATTSLTDGPQSALLSGLAADTCYQFSAIATNAAGDVTSRPGADSATFYTGEISVQKLTSGLADGSRDATFAFHRARTDAAMRHDLTVHYALSGSAIPGTDIAPQSGSLVIPAGTYCELLRIPVLPEATHGATLTVTLQPGPYKTAAADSATVRLYTSEAARNDLAPSDFARQVVIQSHVDLGGETVSDFPVLVRLGANIPGFSYADFQQPNGADLAFFDGTGRILPYEIQSWNPTGESLVWVRMPTFGDETLLYMSYGRDLAVENNPAEVWDDYFGVWHFEGADSNRYSPDASANLLDAHNGAHITDNTGIVGSARALNTTGTSGDFGLLVPRSAPLHMGKHFSLSGWVLRHPGTPSWDHLFYRKASSDNGTGWATEIRGDQIGKMRIYAANGGNREIETGLASDTWTYLTFVFDDTRLRLFTNGELLVDTSLPDTLNESVRPISFGTDSERNDNPWYGYFDEFRIRLDAVNLARAAADYAIMNDPDALTYSPVAAETSSMISTPPTLTRLGEKFYAITATLDGGTAQLLAVCNDSLTNALSQGLVTGPYTCDTIPLHGLADNTCYTVALVVTNASGASVRFQIPEPILTGALSIEVGEVASARHGLNGFFTIRRPEAASACLHDLTVSYTLSGTAVAGTDFADTLTGTVVIPAGVSSIDLPVTTLPTATAGATLTLSIAPGFYELGSDASATMEFSGASLFDFFTHRIAFTVKGITDENVSLANFPVLVRLNPATIPGFRYASFKDAIGTGLIFTDENDQAIPYEIDTWNPAGESLLWVKVPNVRANTSFYAYYGAKPENIIRLTDGTSATDTWSDYIGVWHLNETGDASVPIYDATANDLDGTAGHLSLATENGIIGRARRISTSAGEGSNVGRIVIPYKPAMDIPSGIYTASWWVHANTFSWTYFITRKWNDNSKAWGLQLNDTRAKLRVYPSDWHREYDLNMTLENGTWYKLSVVCRCDWGRVYYYVNGEFKGDYEMWNWPENGTDPLFIGGMGSGWGTLDGDMDEVRLRPSGVDGAWVQAEYLQETNPDFLQYGPAEPIHPTTIILFR